MACKATSAKSVYSGNIKAVLMTVAGFDSTGDQRPL